MTDNWGKLMGEVDEMVERELEWQAQLTSEEAVKYIAEYKCGCSDGPKSKRNLSDYCATHGDDLRRFIAHVPRRRRKGGKS